MINYVETLQKIVEVGTLEVKKICLQVIKRNHSPNPKKKRKERIILLILS